MAETALTLQSAVNPSLSQISPPTRFADIMPAALLRVRPAETEKFLIRGSDKMEKQCTFPL